MDRDERAIAKKLDKPVLLVRGGRDQQVTAIDQEIWGTALGAKAQSLILPELDHFFIKDLGQQDDSLHLTPGTVDASLIEIVAKFILGQTEE